MPEKDERVIEAMETYGGSFVKALAECLRRADVNNYQKLKNTFTDYFNEYRLMANK
jgi:pyruvate/2-oxoacid:ferredoxin oxidoreductase beta subunit